MNPNERGVHQPEERLTRREALSRIAGLAAVALVLAGGCAEIDPPQATGREETGAPEPPFIDEEAALTALASYVVIFTLVALPLLRRIK